MARGGRRSGTPGSTYTNRKDLNVNRGPLPVQAATGQAYGERAAQVAAQKAIPIARPATDAVPTAPPAGPGGAPAPSAPAVPGGPQPGAVVPLDAPSMRPGEPISAGLPIGPGAGPEALGDLGGVGEDVDMQLRAIFSRFPNEDLRRILEMMDTDDGSGLS